MNELSKKENALMGTRENMPIERIDQLHSSDILPQTVKNRHIDGVIIEIGDSSDLPDGTTNTKAFFSEDENKLYIWNSVEGAWKSTTLS